MKTILKFTTVVALMLVTVTGMANEPKFNLKTKSATKSLVFEMEYSEQTTVILKDSDGNVIYSESVSNASYSKKFNLENLEDGLYYFTTENKLREIVYTIDVTDTDVKIIDKEENTKPYFRRVGGKVLLNFLNLDESSVKVKVVDAENRVLFEETYTDTKIVEKAFDFTKALEGTYTISVEDFNNTFYESIAVN